MSHQVSLPDLLMAIGADNIRFQDVRASMDNIKVKKGVTVISFATDAMSPGDVVTGSWPKGLVLWVDPNLMKQRLEELKAGNGMTMEKVVQQRDELLAALVSVIEYADNHQDSGPVGDGWQSDEQAAAIALGREVISKAKGAAPAAGEAV